MTERSTDSIPRLEALIAEADQPSTATAKNLEIALAVAQAAADRKAGDIVILDVADVA
jgi:hypothetical protein